MIPILHAGDSAAHIPKVGLVGIERMGYAVMLEQLEVVAEAGRSFLIA
ncbi:MAG: hypothetical protein RMK32_00310 [Anaerolineae bacterium]|nr:hypothetical protein [Thermoflexus sp.]MDW8064057.1 hypothetical protein [Anaerolineae bacterium]